MFLKDFMVRLISLDWSKERLQKYSKKISLSHELKGPILRQVRFRYQVEFAQKMIWTNVRLCTAGIPRILSAILSKKKRKF